MLTVSDIRRSLRRKDRFKYLPEWVQYHGKHLNDCLPTPCVGYIVANQARIVETINRTYELQCRNHWWQRWVYSGSYLSFSSALHWAAMTIGDDKTIRVKIRSKLIGQQ